MPTVTKSTKPDSQLINDPDLCAMEMEEFEKHLLQRSTKLSAKQKRKLAQMQEEEKRLQEEVEDSISAKKQKLDSEDSDEENRGIVENVSGPLINFVKGGALTDKKKASPKAVAAKVEWTEEDTNGDIVLSQESSSSDDECSTNVEPVVKKPVKVTKANEKKLQKRNSLPALPSTGQNGIFSTQDEWATPLKDGETEYFVPSRKQKIKEANTTPVEPKTPVDGKKPKLLKNPFAVSIGKP